MRYPFWLDCGHRRAMLSDYLLSLGDCHGTTDFCGDVSAGQCNGISEVDRGFGFVVLSVWVVNWKNTRRDGNQRYPEDNDHPRQILHGKVTRSRQQTTPVGLLCQHQSCANEQGNQNRAISASDSRFSGSARLYGWGAT